MKKEGTFCINDEKVNFSIRDSELTILTDEVSNETIVALIEELLSEYCIRIIFKGHKLFRRMNIFAILFGTKQEEENLLQFPERTA